MTEGVVFPVYDKHAPVWPNPAAGGDIGAKGMYYADAIDKELTHPSADWLVLTRDYASPSADTAPLEPDNANGWYDAAKQELHLVAPTQSPQEVAQGAATMLGKSRLGLKRLFLHPCFTVGYGSKDHCTMPNYGLVAAAYGDGRPVRLANDRFEQFQAGLKLHEFRMQYRMAVDRGTASAIIPSRHHRQWRRPGELLRRAYHGGRLLGPIDLLFSAQRYSRERDLLARDRCRFGARLWRARDHGGDRDMVDEIAQELGIDPIEFRLVNVLKTGMRNTQGRSPAAQFEPGEVLEKARAHVLWTERAARKAAYDAAHPGHYYGIGFGCIERRFGTGAEASLAKVELTSDGRITLWHTGTEIGTGTSSGQAVACARWLGRPADVLHMAITDWPDLPVETSGDPHSMSQADQDSSARTRAGARPLPRSSGATRPTTSPTRRARRQASCSTTVCGRRRWRFGGGASVRDPRMRVGRTNP